MIDYKRVQAEVKDYCDMVDFDTFDHDGIMYDIQKFANDNDLIISSIDDIPYDVFVDIVNKNDNGSIKTIA